MSNLKIITISKFNTGEEDYHQIVLNAEKIYIEYDSNPRTHLNKSRALVMDITLESVPLSVRFESPPR